MTSPQPGPTLLAEREALAEAKCSCGHVPRHHTQDRHNGGRAPFCIVGDCDCPLEFPDALLASGVVQTPVEFVAGLAGDEAAVAAIVADQKAQADSWGEPLPGAELKMRARTGLRALAAALGGTE